MTTGILSVVSQITLDGTGAGTIRFAPAGEEWEVRALTVNAFPRTEEAEVRVYRGHIGDAYLVDSSSSGSTGDTSDTAHTLPDGTPLYVVWSGGNPGAIASATLRGTKFISRGGFRAVS